jgi:hypothetical protein
MGELYIARGSEKLARTNNCLPVSVGYVHLVKVGLDDFPGLDDGDCWQ